MQQQGPSRHLVTPRVTLFLERAGRWLFIEGAAHKWWAGRLNGIGGSVEPGESIRAAAERECSEETGLSPTELSLAAIAHIRSAPSVLLFCFRGHLPEGELQPCDEGTFHWVSLDQLEQPDLPLMPDLPFLLPKILFHRPGDEPHSLAFDFSPPFEEHAP